MKKTAMCLRPLSMAKRPSSSLSIFATSGQSTWQCGGINALHPQSILIEIFRQEQDVVMAKLEQQANDRRRTLRQLLDILNAIVPDFVAISAAAILGK